MSLLIRKERITSEPEEKYLSRNKTIKKKERVNLKKKFKK